VEIGHHPGSWRIRLINARTWLEPHEPATCPGLPWSTSAGHTRVPLIAKRVTFRPVGPPALVTWMSSVFIPATKSSRDRELVLDVEVVHTRARK
jgi:hypothetical protein